MSIIELTRFFQYPRSAVPCLIRITSSGINEWKWVNCTLYKTKTLDIYICLFLSLPLINSHHSFRVFHWGQLTHIYVGNRTIIGSNNGLSLGRRQDIVCTNAGMLLIGTMGKNFSDILSEIHIFSFKKMHLKCRRRNVGHFVSASMRTGTKALSQSMVTNFCDTMCRHYATRI